MFLFNCFPNRTASIHPADSDTPQRNGTNFRNNDSNVLQSSKKRSERQENSTDSQFLTTYGEDDDEEEVLQQTFTRMDKNKNGKISSTELNSALGDAFFEHEAEFIQVLKSLFDDHSDDIDFKSFKQAADKIPRARGHRVQWVRTLGLEGLLARRLKIGDFSDGLSGVRSMSIDELRASCLEFCREIPTVVEHGWRILQTGPKFAAAEEANSKFCSTQGAFTGKFASLELFYQGPEGLIGSPNPNLFEGMHREHCLRSNSRTKFTTPNYNFTTCSDWEWRFVVCPANLPEEGFQYPHTPLVKDRADWNGRDKADTGEWKGLGRDAVPLEGFLSLPTVQNAGLRQEEVIALRLYTGPLYVLYNAVLRGFPQPIVEALGGNRYETTIFCLCSGITKLSKVSAVPPNRLLYRGLGGMLLPDEFWKGSSTGFRGGVEYGLMSTTTSMATAIEYSGIDRKRATIFEIQAGRIDVGASLSSVSQYPGEEEFLMQPLSCLEVIGRPRVDLTAKGEVVEIGRAHV